MEFRPPSLNREDAFVIPCHCQSCQSDVDLLADLRSGVESIVLQAFDEFVCDALQEPCDNDEGSGVFSQIAENVDVQTA